jgi:hypothetical protein
MIAPGSYICFVQRDSEAVSLVPYLFLKHALGRSGINCSGRQSALAIGASEANR